MSVGGTLVGRQAETQGGRQWNTQEVRTELNDPFEGRRIFRKSFVLVSLPDGDTVDITHGISNLRLTDGVYIQLWGYMSDGTVARRLSSDADIIEFSVRSSIIRITTGADLTSFGAKIFLEYVKN